MRISIASDHGGFKLKTKLVKYLVKKGHDVIDLGCNSTNSVDYPLYAIKVAQSVRDKEADFGIAICKTGIGMDIACNKVDGVRCAKPRNIKEAKLARLHNDANVLALGAISPTFKNMDIVDAFLKTKFSNEERHINRISEITKYESIKLNNKNLESGDKE